MCIQSLSKSSVDVLPVLRAFVFCIWLLHLVAHVTVFALVSVLGIAYIHADQELTSTLFAVVLFEADVATDSA